MASAGVPSVLEPSGLSRGNPNRPDGLTLFPWSGGKCVVWDYTCRDTLCQSNVGATSQGAGKAAQKAEGQKLANYNNLVMDYNVMPVANETFGAWGQIGMKFIKAIGTRIAEATGEKRSTYFLFQSLGMATQRGNVASVLGMVPSLKKIDELYYI